MLKMPVDGFKPEYKSMSHETFGPTYPPKVVATPSAKKRLKVVEKVSVLPVVTTLNLPSARVLKAAMKKPLDGCVVIGIDEDGELYFASSWADGAEVLWWMEKAKLALLRVGQE